MDTNKTNLFEQALHCLMLKEPEQKVLQTKQLYRLLLDDKLGLDALEEVVRVVVPGRPEKPALVDPRSVPKRNIISLPGRLTLVHAIAHIEFNAINLALDAVYRFQNMPAQYYRDWMQVAAEEALHFTLLSDYLTNHGSAYGQENAHNGLWEMAVKTDNDVMVRMALVPRVLEARGLDVTPTMIKKLASTGDTDLIAILQRIFDDEIGHVKIGTTWFNSVCKERQLDPDNTFISLIDTYMAGAKFGPFETDARKKAGFSDDEMQRLLNHF